MRDPAATPWTGAAGALADRIAAFVRASLADAPTEPFEALAADLRDHQIARDPWVARVDAVPVDLFRDPGIGRPGAVVFRTSGTTGGAERRGEHHLASTALYDLGSVPWARRCVPDLPRRVVALLEPLPTSSLAHMVAGLGEVSWHVRDGGLGAVAVPDEPVFVAATAFALAEWLERAPEPLPAGSVVMVTGGYKGRIRTIAADALVAEARRRLRPERVVTEYGMTELSSQLWGTPETEYRPPPWLRVSAVDPDGRPARVGQLRFTDLCNLDGAVCVETMDLGEVHRDGTVTLHGRLSGAPPRGCSLAVDR